MLIFLRPHQTHYEGRLKKEKENGEEEENHKNFGLNNNVN